MTIIDTVKMPGYTQWIENFVERTLNAADVAAGFQKSVCEVMVDKLIAAADARGCDVIALAGGVACNSRLRAELEKRKGNRIVYYPSPILCTDNAAMIGAAAYPLYLKGEFADLDLNAEPNSNIC